MTDQLQTENCFPCYINVDVHCFPKRSSYEVNITENNPPGTSVLQVTVTQHRPGAILTYKIVPSNNEFRINKSTVSGTLALEVRSQNT